MKTVSALAIALSVALGSAFAMAPAADAATMTAKKPTTACVATKTKPCGLKHVAAKAPVKKHKVMAKAATKIDPKAPKKA